jgi:hypothetical protein
MFRHWLKLLLLIFMIFPFWASPALATDQFVANPPPGINPTLVANQPFHLTMRLFKPITITNNKNLIFPTTTLIGANVSLVVGPDDAGAADFSIFGGKNRSVIRTVIESSVRLTASGSAGGITVDRFTVAGPTAFDASGKANGLKVGATARILADSTDGDYAGVGTFRVIYQ